MPDINQIRKIEGIDAKRAYFAFECVKEAKNENSVKDDKYKSYIKKMPMLIKTNGLGQTLAFYLSKNNNDNAYNLILKQISQYLLLKEITTEEILQNSELLNFITTQQPDNYRYITKEILNLLNWWRRFVEGLLEGD